jgi:hypothetical protein
MSDLNNLETNCEAGSMPKLLARRVDIAHRETAPSYLARLAVVNGVSGSDLAVDMGFSLKRLINLDEAAVRALSEIGGLDDFAREDMVSWTGHPQGNVRSLFRNEVFVSRAIRSPTVRGCPICLKEDAAATEVANAGAMVMQGHWQLRDVYICVRHGHPLVDLWTFNVPTERFEYSARLREISKSILNGDLDQRRCDPSPYDLWLDARLGEGCDDTWLKDCSLYAAVTFCGLLGCEIARHLYNDSMSAENQKSSCAGLGFEIVKCGPSKISAALHDLAERADGATDKPNKAFGEMYKHLGRGYLNEPGFEPFRHLLRECILEVWPVAGGEVLLGTVLPSRRLHSVATVASEIGIGIDTMTRLLTAAHVLSASDARPLSRRVFDADHHAEDLIEMSRLVGSPKLRAILGATVSQFNALVDDGVIAPYVSDDTIQARWSPSRIESLLKEISLKAAKQLGSGMDWENLFQARLRSGIALNDLIDAIRANEIDVVRTDREQGIGSFLVRLDQVDRMGIGSQQMRFETDLNLTEMVLAIGLRSTIKFRSFLDAGHSPATRRRHPTNGKEQLYLSAADVAAFHDRFMTIATIVERLGLDRSEVRKRIRARSIARFAPDGAEYGKIYLRRDVQFLGH